VRPRYIPRALESTLRRAAGKFPAVVLTGLKDPDHAKTGPLGGPHL